MTATGRGRPSTDTILLEHSKMKFLTESVNSGHSLGGEQRHIVPDDPKSASVHLITPAIGDVSPD